MGPRANFVFIPGGAASAYHDPWAALGSTWPFAAGPDEAVAAAELGSATDALFDWAVAVAGYLLGFDERQAIVFDYPELDAFADHLARRGITGITRQPPSASLDRTAVSLRA